MWGQQWSLLTLFERLARDMRLAGDPRWQLLPRGKYDLGPGTIELCRLQS